MTLKSTDLKLAHPTLVFFLQSNLHYEQRNFKDISAWLTKKNPVLFQAMWSLQDGIDITCYWITLSTYQVHFAEIRGILLLIHSCFSFPSSLPCSPTSPFWPHFDATLIFNRKSLFPGHLSLDLCTVVYL